MRTAEAAHDFPGFVSIKLTDAHNRLGQIVDDCQLEPVILRKHQRNRAAVVSMTFLEQALEALHGHREVITPETMTDEQKADLATSWPSADELATGRWRDE
jgi:hypothetical protein